MWKKNEKLLFGVKANLNVEPVDSSEENVDQAEITELEAENKPNLEDFLLKTKTPERARNDKSNVFL